MTQLDKKTFVIGMLSLSAVALFVTNVLVQRPAAATESVKDRDYQAVTARVIKGGEALYLTDNKTGQVAAFMYNPNKRAVEPVSIQPIMNAFIRSPAPGAPAAGGPNGRKTR